LFSNGSRILKYGFIKSFPEGRIFENAVSARV